MKRESVKSSQIKSIGYDAKTKILEVEFNGGGVYQYENVIPEVHSELMKASSIGSHFHKAIKKGNYKFKKMPVIDNTPLNIVCAKCGKTFYCDHK